MNKPEYLILHHTGGTDANPLADSSNFTFDQCNELHRKNWNFKSSLGYYIGYHYYISKDGKVRQGRSHRDDGAHTIGKNQSSIGICLAGNFDATLPTNEQTEALTRLLKRLMEELKIPASKIVPHRTFANKTCYGKRLSDDWAQNLVTAKAPAMSIEEMEKLIVQLTAQIKAIQKEVARKKNG